MYGLVFLLVGLKVRVAYICMSNMKNSSLCNFILRQIAYWNISYSVDTSENFPFCFRYCCHRHFFIQKVYAPSSSLLQGKHLPFTPSPLRLNIYRLFVILSLTQLYRYTPAIFLFSTATPGTPQTNWTSISSESGLVKN